MKNLFTLVLSLAMAVAANAQTISLSSASQKAANVFARSGVSAAKGSIMAPPQLANVTTIGQDTCFYVFNNPQGGYAIIGGDAASKEVLAVSKAGSFDYDKLPDAAKELLAEYAHSIAAAKALGYKEVTATTVAARKDIDTLCLTAWDQASPWDQDIPTLPNLAVFGDNANSTAAIGCVAVATAQVLYALSQKYSMPTHVKSDIKKKLNFVDVNNDDKAVAQTPLLSFLKSETINWDDMTNKNGKSASRLMLLCGLFSNMGYGVESGTTEDKVAEGLTRDLGISCKFEEQDQTSDTEWEKKVYNELAQGRPIVYGAESMYIGQGGHCFVIDGYEKDTELFHVNWGWGGMSNDYYALTATSATALPNGAAWGSHTDSISGGYGSWMLPGQQGVGATMGDYRKGHDMVYQIVFSPTASASGVTISSDDDEGNAKAVTAAAIECTTIKNNGKMKIQFSEDGALNTGNDIDMIWGVELVPCDEDGNEIDDADGILLASDGKNSKPTEFAAGAYQTSYTIDLDEYYWGDAKDIDENNDSTIANGKYSVTPCMYYDNDNDEEYVSDEDFAYVTMPDGWVAPRVNIIDSETTAVQKIEVAAQTSAANVRKVLRKHRIIVEHNGKQYSAAGAQIK